MTASLTVRPATPDDREDAVRLLLEMERHYEGPAASPGDAAAGAVSMLLIDGPPWLGMLLARADGPAVGFATFSVLLPTASLRPGLFVKDIFVTAAARGQGVGRALIKGLATEAQGRGCVRVDWSADRGNRAACALYDANGAARLATSVHFRLDAATIARLATEPDG